MELYKQRPAKVRVFGAQKNGLSPAAPPFLLLCALSLFVGAFLPVCNNSRLCDYRHEVLKETLLLLQLLQLK